MQNQDRWQPGKFILSDGRLIPSKEISPLSQITATLQSRVYQFLIEIHVSGRILDLGCGEVPLYELYRDRVSDICCVDWPNSLHKNIHLDHEFDLNEPIGLEDNSFDTILATDLLEHIRKPADLFREMARLLAPQGKLILTTPFLYWIHEEPHDFHRYTSFMLEELCRQNNLEVVFLEPYGGGIHVLMDQKAKLLRHKPGLLKLHNWICLKLIKTGFVQKQAKKHQNLLPLGYGLVAQKK